MQTSLTVAEVARRVTDYYSNDPQGRRLTKPTLAGYMQDTLTTMRMKAGRAFYGIDEEEIAAFLAGPLLTPDGENFNEIVIPIAAEFGTAFIAQVRERGENVNTAGAQASESDRQGSRDMVRGM